VISAVDNRISRVAQLKSLIDRPDEYDFLFISPGNFEEHGQVISYARLNGKYIGDDPLDGWWTPEVLAKDKEQIPVKGHCYQQAEYMVQLINTNLTGAVVTLNVIDAFVRKNVLQSYVIFNNFNETKSMEIYESDT
jgi:hypothetical protein